jgi:hypothetical protein
MASESWVVAFVQAKTDARTVCLFTFTLTAMVFAVTIFLASGKKK